MPTPIAHVEAVLQLVCCNRTTDLPVAAADIDAARGGGELARTLCHTCGAEYTFGVLARTRQESLADEEFEHVSAAALAEVGIDEEDFDESADEVRMCARCDGTAGAGDLCRGCGEYIHTLCSSRNPRNAHRHTAEEHWEEPKAPMLPAATASDEDDGSRLTGDDDLDFVAED